MANGKAILGIDLRKTSVKVVEALREKEGFSLINWGMTDVPYQLLDKHPQLEEAKAEALRKLIQINNIRSREAVVVVGGSNTFVKRFTLTDMTYAETAQAIKWKFAEEVPFPVEEGVFDFYPLAQAEAPSEKIDYVAACISRQLYLETQYLLGKAGIKLLGITVLPDALLELFRNEVAKDGEKIASIIYMGKRTTNISIYRQGNFEFNRELTIGGENITQSMAGILVSTEGQIEITPEKAENIKTEYGVPVDLDLFPKLAEIPLSQLQAMVRPALEKIRSEIARTFEYYHHKGQPGEAAVGKIILTGGSSQTQHLIEFLSLGLGIPVVTPEPLPKFNPRLAAALGAALVGTKKINLMPDEVKYRWKLLAQKLLSPQVLLFAFVCFLALAYASFWGQVGALQKELVSVNKRLEEYKPRLARLDAIENASREEEKRKLALRAYEEKKTRMPMVFEEISQLIPASVNINILNMTPTSLQMWGTVFRKEDAAENILSRFVLMLSVSPLLENVQLVQAVKNEDYLTEAFNFEITAGVKSK